MNDADLQPWAFRLVQYFPNLARGEAVNLGVVFYSPHENRLEARLLRDDADFARLRRLHPHADLPLLRGMEAELTSRLAGFEGDAALQIARLDDVLSNTIQLGPQRAVLTASAAAELDRIFDEYVAPPRTVRARGETAPSLDSPAAIRRRASEVFASAGVLRRMHSVGAATWTYPGDPMRLDFHYRASGLDSFAQVLSLARDPAAAKALCFTAERVRAKLGGAQFTAITEAPPQPENERHSFVQALLGEQRIEIVPLPQLEPWARKLATVIQ